MDLSDTPKPNPANAVRVIDGSVFIMSPDSSQLHALNDVGAGVWQLCDEQHTVADIISVLEAEYEVDPARLQADVLAFLDELVVKGLVEVG